MAPSYVVCMTANQDSMYAVINQVRCVEDAGSPFALVKSEYQTAALRNSTWSVVSTTSESYFTIDADGVRYYVFRVTCYVDRNGVFTMRYPNGVGFRYNTLASKNPKAQTCVSARNGLGE